MTCPSCGTPAAAQAAFCSRCGAPLAASGLVREVRESSGVLWLRGRSIETRDAAGYRPFAEQIRAWAGTPADWERLLWRTLALALGREHARCSIPERAPA